ncbi:hypothetical protein DIPPA_31045 [Diplonema papillatum]|nr:hypothetical protein DIPPA_31045 [Diplonema papillatum]
MLTEILSAGAELAQSGKAELAYALYHGACISDDSKLRAREKIEVQIAICKLAEERKGDDDIRIAEGALREAVASAEGLGLPVHTRLRLIVIGIRLSLFRGLSLDAIIPDLDTALSLAASRHGSNDWFVYIKSTEALAALQQSDGTTLRSVLAHVTDLLDLDLTNSSTDEDDPTSVVLATFQPNATRMQQAVQRLVLSIKDALAEHNGERPSSISRRYETSFVQHAAREEEKNPGSQKKRSLSRCDTDSSSGRKKRTQADRSATATTSPAAEFEALADDGEWYPCYLAGDALSADVEHGHTYQIQLTSNGPELDADYEGCLKPATKRKKKASRQRTSGASNRIVFRRQLKNAWQRVGMPHEERHSRLAALVKVAKLYGGAYPERSCALVEELAAGSENGERTLHAERRSDVAGRLGGLMVRSLRGVRRADAELAVASAAEACRYLFEKFGNLASNPAQAHTITQPIIHACHLTAAVALAAASEPIRALQHLDVVSTQQTEASLLKVTACSLSICIAASVPDKPLSPYIDRFLSLSREAFAIAPCLAHSAMRVAAMHGVTAAEDLLRVHAPNLQDPPPGSQKVHHMYLSLLEDDTREADVTQLPDAAAAVRQLASDPSLLESLVLSDLNKRYPAAAPESARVIPTSPDAGALAFLRQWLPGGAKYMG